jgi:hypothetical protein
MDPAAEPHDKAQDMLDQQQAHPSRRKIDEEFGQFVDLDIVHARDRLVEQHDGRSLAMARIISAAADAVVRPEQRDQAV